MQHVVLGLRHRERLESIAWQSGHSTSENKAGHRALCGRVSGQVSVDAQDDEESADVAFIVL